MKWFSEWEVVVEGENIRRMNRWKKRDGKGEN
jgi:hypothetical protein